MQEILPEGFGLGSPEACLPSKVMDARELESILEARRNARYPGGDVAVLSAAEIMALSTAGVIFVNGEDDRFAALTAHFPDGGTVEGIY